MACPSRVPHAGECRAGLDEVGLICSKWVCLVCAIMNMFNVVLWYALFLGWELSYDRMPHPMGGGPV